MMTKDIQKKIKNGLVILDIPDPDLKPFGFFPANIHLLKVNYRNTTKRREVQSEFTIKTPERQ